MRLHGAGVGGVADDEWTAGRLRIWALGRRAKGTTGRHVPRSLHEASLERVRGSHATEAYKRATRKRKAWIEPLFGEAKQWHGLRQFRLRGLPRVNRSTPRECPSPPDRTSSAGWSPPGGAADTPPAGP